MATVIRMPAVLASAVEAAIQSWSVQEGQTIEVGTALADIETDKAVVEYAAEVAGVVGKLIAREGDNLAVGAPIAVVLDAGEGPDHIGPALAAAGVPEEAPAPAPAEAPASAETSPTEAPVTEPPSGNPSLPARTDDGARIFASPIVRRLARERGLELSALTGSGPAGRIVRRDLDGIAVVAPASAPSAAAPLLSPTASAGFTDVPLSAMRRTIARRLTESKTTVPHFYVTAHVRVDALLELRAQINAASSRRISVNDLVIAAVARALRAVPAANAIWGGDHIRLLHGVDLAIAVSVEGGLMTPVLRGVDGMTLTQISEATATAAERARAGRLAPEELQGGGFSISNLGMYGVDEFSAILNPPQAGILAVGATKPQPVVVDGQIVVGTVMTVTLSADHRVIDGAVAAEWMAEFVRLVEHPLSMLI